MPVKVTLTSQIPALVSGIQTKATANVASAGKFCQNYAQLVAPKDTGALAASIYVSGPGDDTTYPQAESGAIDRNPLIREVVTEIKPQEVDDKSGPQHPVAVIAPAAPYGIFQEDGTRYMAPQPFMRPAAEQTRNQFLGLMVNILG